ncbi:hypothetical protein BDEG_22581 [Batrachochytrium dendrobatidis JEL423]|uniref:Uncharacterized protein n=1 Tax=Batrachochytrium dendrobatidis (strain JEL423) TaxID=403673 RepID=A0A177WF68_BATDL|nr:hypothetical protein BDEG_22581 [Batrachochytrium dendrobatidis JEL423]
MLKAESSLWFSNIAITATCTSGRQSTHTKAIKAEHSVPRLSRQIFTSGPLEFDTNCNYTPQHSQKYSRFRIHLAKTASPIVLEDRLLLQNRQYSLRLPTKSGLHCLFNRPYSCFKQRPSYDAQL